VTALDSTIIPLLRCVHHYDDISALLGNTIIGLLLFLTTSYAEYVFVISICFPHHWL